jgi:hypothetical protein
MDLYSIYEELFPDMPEEEFYKLPGPTSILMTEGYGLDWAEVVYLDKGSNIHTIVIKVEAHHRPLLIRIRDGYHSELGYDYNPEVEIVEAVVRKVIEYIKVRE